MSRSTSVFFSLFEAYAPQACWNKSMCQAHGASWQPSRLKGRRLQDASVNPHCSIQDVGQRELIQRRSAQQQNVTESWPHPGLECEDWSVHKEHWLADIFISLVCHNAIHTEAAPSSQGNSAVASQLVPTSCWLGAELLIGCSVPAIWKWCRSEAQIARHLETPWCPNRETAQHIPWNNIVDVSKHVPQRPVATSPAAKHMWSMWAPASWLPSRLNCHRLQAISVNLSFSTQEVHQRKLIQRTNAQHQNVMESWPHPALQCEDCSVDKKHCIADTLISSVPHNPMRAELAPISQRNCAVAFQLGLTSCVFGCPEMLLNCFVLAIWKAGRGKVKMARHLETPWCSNRKLPEHISWNTILSVFRNMPHLPVETNPSAKHMWNIWDSASRQPSRLKGHRLQAASANPFFLNPWCWPDNNHPQQQSVSDSWPHPGLQCGDWSVDEKHRVADTFVCLIVHNPTHAEVAPSSQRNSAVGPY